MFPRDITFPRGPCPKDVKSRECRLSWITIKKKYFQLRLLITQSANSEKKFISYLMKQFNIRPPSLLPVVGLSQ